MTEPTPGQDAVAPGRSAMTLAVVLALGALGVSAYLSYTSIVSGQSPAGCGAGSGCGEVLASKWSRWLGVPVSVLAVAVYALVLAALPGAWSADISARRTGAWLLTFSAAAILSSALWFIYLQLFTLDAICPYCMAGHALGFLLAVLLLWQFKARRWQAGLLGLAGVVVVAVTQINSPGVVFTLDAPTAGMDSDTGTPSGRVVTVLDGRLTLNLADEPVLGSPDAEHVMVMLYDYACLHCRHTHGVLLELLRDRPGLLAAVQLPTPLNHGCNPHAPEEMDARFDESCELAKIAVAVFLADRAAFEDFDRWMYEPQAPRKAADARAEAVRRVGKNQFEQAYAGPRMQEISDRNVYVYGRSGADRVPVLIVPGRATVVGRVDNVRLLIDMLDKSATAAPQ